MEFGTDFKEKQARLDQLLQEVENLELVPEALKAIRDCQQELFEIIEAIFDGLTGRKS